MRQIFSGLTLLLFIGLGTLSDGRESKRLEPLMLEETEQSAESFNSEEDYEKVKPLKEEPKPTIRMTGYFIEPEFIPNPEIIKEGDEDQKKKPEKKDEDVQISGKDADRIIYWAKNFLSQGTRYIEINGNRVAIHTDCSNFVRAVYWKAMKIDLFYESVSSGAAGADTRSGCGLLYSYFSKNYRYGKKPKKGDVVFFDNTYDKNRNKRWDDPLTHVGIVTDVDAQGTVTYVHGNTGAPKSVKEAFLNTAYPKDYKKDGKVINTYLRKKYQWEKESQRQQLSGDLARGFGGF